QGGEGRWLGGRPPYGYMLVDAGPHSNPTKAAQGLRRKRLVPDPVTAAVVQRIFADYLSGKGIRVITDDLTREGVVSPSHYDLKRNRHRAETAGAWGKCGVRSILQNPSYMGKRVFGRQRRAEVLVDPADASFGYVARMKNNPVEEWVFPAEDTHEALVTPDDFAAVQARFASRRGGRGPKAPRKDRRVYPLQGLVICAACGRRMYHTTIPKGGKEYAYATCRLSTAEYARHPELEATHPKTSYLRADKLAAAVDGWLAEISDDDHVDDTAKLLAAAEQDRHQAMTGGVDRDAESHRARQRLMEAEGRLERARATLDAGADPAVVARWINDAENDRRSAEADLARLAPDRPPTADEVKELLIALRGILDRLSTADPTTMREVYRELGLRAVWQPRSPVVQVSISPELPGQEVRDSDGGGGGI
ncbi:MAG: recombinase family protein, partial [Acidimicrobiia bacterium]